MNTLKQNRIFWDKNCCEGNWENFWQLRKFRYERDPYLLEIISRQVKGSHVLEIGCGQGVDLAEICRRNRKVTAVDLSGASLRRAQSYLRSLGLYADLRQMNAEHLKFSSGKFNCVYSCGVFHHIRNTYACVEEVHRVLKKNGKAVIMLYNKYSLVMPFVLLMRFFTSPFRSSFLKRRNKSSNPKMGTAIREILGAPLVKAFSAAQAKMLFHAFREVRIMRTKTGFLKFVPLVRSLRMKRLIESLDRFLAPVCGMELFIIAKK